MASELIILLLIAGIACVALEIYLPGGFMGIVGAGIVVWATVEAYKKDTDFGTMLLITGIGGSVAASWFSFKYLSKTKEGQKALLMEANIELPEDKHAELDGKEGLTLTDMHPSGIIEIEGERYDAASKGEYIEKDSKIKVISIEADNIYIREISQSKENNEESHS